MEKPKLDLLTLYFSDEPFFLELKLIKVLYSIQTFIFDHNNLIMCVPQTILNNYNIQGNLVGIKALR